MHASAPHPQHPTSTLKVLQISLAATLVYIAVLVIAGLRAHSLALLSEAGHNVSDFLALLLSLAAVYMQRRPPSASHTYGFDRAGVLAALANSVTLVLIAFYIFYEAGHRLYAPVEVRPKVMIWAAAAGVVMNGLIALMLWRSSRDVNLRSVFLHELGDTLSTAAVIAGGVAIMFTGQVWIDSALSFGIGALILWSSFGIIRETLNILLEATPRGMEVQLITGAIRDIEGVLDIHDLHVWSIGSDTHALSCHIRIADIPPSASERILRDVRERLQQRFRINHTTIQFEHETCEVAHGCVLPVRDAHRH
jgi:cobalt-zinc-cadmium efflux system protein